MTRGRPGPRDAFSRLAFLEPPPGSPSSHQVHTHSPRQQRAGLSESTPRKPPAPSQLHLGAGAPPGGRQAGAPLPTTPAPPAGTSPRLPWQTPSAAAPLRWNPASQLQCCVRSTCAHRGARLKAASAASLPSGAAAGRRHPQGRAWRTWA